MKFKVTFSEICTREIDVIADTQKEAEQKVMSGDFDISDSCETYSELARIDYSEEIPE